MASHNEEDDTIMTDADASSSVPTPKAEPAETNPTDTNPTPSTAAPSDPTEPTPTTKGKRKAPPTPTIPSASKEPYISPFHDPNLLPEKLDAPARELYELLKHIPGALNPPPPGGFWGIDQPKPEVVYIDPEPIWVSESGEEHPAFYADLDIIRKPKPWKNPNWKPKKERVKTLKQIVADEAKADAEAAAARAERGEPEPEFEWDDAMKEAYKKLGLTLPKRYPSFNDLEAGPSLHPERAGKWCDITGLPAKYTDPKTGLRYYNSEVYQYIKTLSAEQIQDYLSLRGANVVLK